MTNSVRVNNLSPGFHKATAANIPLIRIDANYTNDSKRVDPVVVYYDDQAVATFDKERDAIKLLNTDDQTPNFYTVMDTNTKLSIQALPLLPTDTTQIVPLGVKLEKDGPLSFNVRDIENMPSGLHIYLYDTKTGKTQDLTTDPHYKTDISRGTYENRFFLMFTKKDKQHIPVVNNELNAYSSGGKLFVYLLYGDATVAVTNMSGEVIWREAVSGTGYHEINYHFNTGVYVPTLYSNLGKQSKKLFIGNR